MKLHPCLNLFGQDPPEGGGEDTSSLYELPGEERIPFVLKYRLHALNAFSPLPERGEFAFLTEGRAAPSCRSEVLEKSRDVWYNILAKSRITALMHEKEEL